MRLLNSLNIQGHMLAAGTIVLLSTLTKAAWAATGCEAYAQTAIQQQDQNVANQCGFHGPRWSSDVPGHLNWCIGARQDSVEHESAARRTDLANCSRCRAYADNVKSANDHNRQRRCGFSGPRWSDDVNAHFNWCMGAARASVAAENNARANDLDRCRFCDDYSAQAISAQQRNLNTNCQLLGARWSLDRQQHFDWCVDARRESVITEAQTRNNEILKCEECEVYARTAISANDDNISLNCGFTGSQWSSGFDGHYNWCWNLQTRGQLAIERANRTSLLQTCRASPPGRKVACERYAGDAITQFAAYKAARCGTASRRWHDSYQNHFGWCLSVDANQRKEETVARSRTLTECSGRRPHDRPAFEPCTVSVVVTNDECLNIDGTPSLRPSRGTSMSGCGATEEAAKARAIFGFEVSHNICLSEGDTAEPGCCTYEEDTREGCLCQ